VNNDGVFMTISRHVLDTCDTRKVLRGLDASHVHNMIMRMSSGGSASIGSNDRFAAISFGGSRVRITVISSWRTLSSCSASNMTETSSVTDARVDSRDAGIAARMCDCCVGSEWRASKIALFASWNAFQSKGSTHIL
jgi:hypothetical protein